MENLKDKTVCIIDHGMYNMVADKLSEYFGKTYYHTPWEQSFPCSNDTLVGRGFPNYERIDDFFDKMDEIDLFVFTDIFHSGLQTYLRSIGKRVWGSGPGDVMEIDRWGFIQEMQKLGLSVPWTERIIGITELRKYLKTVDDKFVKVQSFFRGDVESFHHVNYDITEALLDKMEFEVGPRKNLIEFIVQDPVKAVVETGYDGYTILGEFPDKCMFGIEIKDKAYIGEVRDYDKIPAQVKEINEILKPLFKKYGYCGFFSSEIRITESGEAFLIDMTCRSPYPPISTMLEVYSNIADIIWNGADGVLVQPEFNAKFGAEVIGKCEFARTNFVQLFYAEDEQQWIKQPHSCMIDEKVYTVPYRYDLEIVASVVAIADDIETMLDVLNKRCDSIKGNGLNLDCSVLKEAVEQIKKL
jgi:hypothetical protein